LAQKLDPETPVYGLQEFDGKSNGAVAPSVETKAAFYLSQIRKVAPHGPYFFIGESSGGKVALEMAQQLAETGEQVPILALLDTFASGGYSQKDGRKISKLRYLLLLVEKHLTTLRRSDWRGKLDYFRYYREKFPQKADELIEQIKRQEETNRKANRLYQPRPYPGKVILFKALRGPRSHDLSNGWERQQIGELAVHPLDCYHGNILFEPWVSEVGQILQKYISAYRTDK
jgi:thioesterase domain-containing protein